MLALYSMLLYRIPCTIIPMAADHINGYDFHSCVLFRAGPVLGNPYMSKFIPLLIYTAYSKDVMSTAIRTLPVIVV